MLYFAYGSNLLTERLVARCPGARPLGTAVLAGHSVEFAKYSWMDGSGKATIIEGRGDTTGIVFELTRGELNDLDRIEGVGKGYDRVDGLTVTSADGPLDVISYIATDPRQGQRPFDWYLALILAGVRQHGLPQDVHLGFHATPWDRDPEPDRPGRRAAISALAKAGHQDWQRLLADQDG